MKGGNVIMKKTIPIWTIMFHVTGLLLLLNIREAPNHLTIEVKGSSMISWFFLAVENVFTSACLTFCDADGLYLLYSALNIHCNTNINICRHRTNDGLLLEKLLFAFATKLNQLCARLQFILSNLFNDIFPIDLNVNGS